MQNKDKGDVMFNRLDKNTFIPISLAVAIALFAMTMAAKTSTRFVSLEKDMIYYAAHVDDLISEIRTMRKEVNRLSLKIELLDEKIDK